MHANITTDGRALTRPILIILAATALVVSLFAIARPAMAGAVGTTVSLQESQRGTNSDDETSDPDCGDFGTTGSGVVWHFILNNLDDGTAAGSLTAEFESAGTVGPITSTKVEANGKTQHFYVFTPTADTLEDAEATVSAQNTDPGEPSGPKLVLSHVCKQSGGQSQSQSQSSSASASASQSVEQSVSASQSASQSASASASVSTSAEQSVEGNTGTPEQSVQGGTGSPAASMGNGAVSATGGSSAIPAIAFGVLALLSLGGLAAVNLATARRRR